MKNQDIMYKFINICISFIWLRGIIVLLLWQNWRVIVVGRSRRHVKHLFALWSIWYQYFTLLHANQLIQLYKIVSKIKHFLQNFHSISVHRRKSTCREANEQKINVEFKKLYCINVAYFQINARHLCRVIRHRIGSCRGRHRHKITPTAMAATDPFP